MRTLFRSTNQSLIQSASLALESEGIAAIVQNEPGGALPFIPSSILVADPDYDRAMRIVRELEPHDPVFPPLALRKRRRRITLIFLLIVVGVLCATIFG
jgi:hypothetical protein